MPYGELATWRPRAGMPNNRISGGGSLTSMFQIGGPDRFKSPRSS